jgi:hypothetical protein
MTMRRRQTAVLATAFKVAAAGRGIGRLAGRGNRTSVTMAGVRAPAGDRRRYEAS